MPCHRINRTPRAGAGWRYWPAPTPRNSAGGSAHPPTAVASVLRGPEAGLVMVRGRTGGGGAPFNLGEMTTTRCTVRTDAGFVGHAYVAGRDERLAEVAALADALLQDPERQAGIAATT